MLQTLKDRWKAEIPTFFRGIKKIAIAVGTPCTAIWVVNSSMGLDLPLIVLSVCKYGIALCAGMGLTAQLTKVS
jgi:hypothetical protein